ncbi:hypothetical protein [Erysipelothrix anatis]|uniref:hypothetical protein n=1 Tax=Erysipelothrix anatis TaxID=2683713 RepID=UPI00135AD1F0|nr:hypothetical protein [Erysipelothrix anatis]
MEKNEVHKCLEDVGFTKIFSDIYDPSVKAVVHLYDVSMSLVNDIYKVGKAILGRIPSEICVELAGLAFVGSVIASGGATIPSSGVALATMTTIDYATLFKLIRKAVQSILVGSIIYS